MGEAKRRRDGITRWRWARLHRHLEPMRTGALVGGVLAAAVLALGLSAYAVFAWIGVPTKGGLASSDLAMLVSYVGGAAVIGASWGLLRSVVRSRFALVAWAGVLGALVVNALALSDARAIPWDAGVWMGLSVLGAAFGIVVGVKATRTG